MFQELTGVGPKRATQLIEQYGDVFDIMASLPLDGKYKYIQNLNEFGSEGLEVGVKLMDLTYDVDSACAWTWRRNNKIGG